MTVNIGKHFEQMLEKLVARGRFQNQGEVIREGLRLLEEREHGYDSALESELLSRLDGYSSRWNKRALNKARRLGRVRLQRSPLRRVA